MKVLLFTIEERLSSKSGTCSTIILSIYLTLITFCYFISILGIIFVSVLVIISLLTS